MPAKNLAVFTRQFSVMIDAGLPLVQCLDILGNQEEHKYFSQVILATRSDVEGGMSLADAMKRHPKCFDALFCNMIAAGEAGGILDTILKRLAVYIEKAVKLNGQVVQKNVEADGTTQAGLDESCDPQGVLLQDHSSILPVSFRNIWVIPRN